MNPVARKLSQEEQDLIAEYLKNGGAITKGKYGVGVENFYQIHSQKRAKQKEEPSDGE